LQQLIDQVSLKRVEDYKYYSVEQRLTVLNVILNCSCTLLYVNIILHETILLLPLSCIRGL